MNKFEAGAKCEEFRKEMIENLRNMPQEKSKPIGMYGETPKIKIGKFEICRFDPSGENNSTWIAHEDGEGGQFSDKLFEKAIDDFFNKNF